MSSTLTRITELLSSQIEYKNGQEKQIILFKNSGIIKMSGIANKGFNISVNEYLHFFKIENDYYLQSNSDDTGFLIEQTTLKTLRRNKYELKQKPRQTYISGAEKLIKSLHDFIEGSNVKLINLEDTDIILNGIPLVKLVFDTKLIIHLKTNKIIQNHERNQNKCNLNY